MLSEPGTGRGVPACVRLERRCLCLEERDGGLLIKMEREGRKGSGCALETWGGGAGGVSQLLWLLGSQEYFFGGAGCSVRSS